MNYQQPVGQPNNMKMPETFQNIGNNVSDSLDKFSNIVNDSVKDFSDQTQAAVDSGSDAASGFLDSNSMFAKLAFVILIVIVFIFILSLGIMALDYFLSPSDNPYLVKGMISGYEGLTIPQDPTRSETIPIKRSNNEEEGMEFTWSVWIYIDNLNIGEQYQAFQHIFNKGNDGYDVAGIANVSNGPGLYLKQMVSNDESEPNTASLYVIMESKSGNNLELTGNNHENTKEIDNIPLKKWVNVIIRMKNTLLEIYINGVVSGRLQFREMPMQNYHDVHVCKNGGFQGKISNLRYYNKALTIFEINSIINSGPDTKVYNTQISKDYNYLSTLWYTSKLY